MAVEPKTKSDQEKMGIALGKLAQEDPTFKVSTDPDTGQTIIEGMGELHLEIIVDRMMREFNVQANVGKPQVAYRETIRKESKAEGKYIRQTGGSGQYGHVRIRLEPNEPGKGYEFVNEVVGGVIPKEFIKPVDQGIKEAHGRRRSRRLRNGGREGDRCTTAAITMSIRTKWPSRLPVRWRSKKPPARPVRYCWSR